ncbi:MAG: VWA domain-containing protein [Acidobacteriia bacterium]|nr:VWA domain-containing protein [Terriglobia bacterium]
MGLQTNKMALCRAKHIMLPLLGLPVLAAAGFLAPRLTWSQAQQSQNPPQTQQQRPFKIGVEVNMVTVPVTVRKPAGGFVKGLPKSAFHVTEDGEEQEILTFEQEGVPTRLAIVLDVSGSVRPEWGTIKYATRKFVENLKSEDQFALITFNTETRLKMDWGTKADRLEDVLTSVYCKDNTNLWDTIYTVSNDVFKDIRDKKAMIIMTDGLDNNSTISYKDALDAAVHSEAAVYVVSKTQAVREAYLADKAQGGWYAGVPEEEFLQADLALRKLAYETGGRVLYPNTFGQLDNIYAQVDEELRNQYTLGYISANTAKDGSYRRIEVTVDAAGATTSARPGYYAPKRK